MWRPNAFFCRCWNGAAVLFSFLPRLRRKFCSAVQADCLLVFFSVGSLTCFCDSRNIVVVFLKAHSPADAAVVLSSRNGLESTPCSRKSLFTEGERSTREVSEALGAQLWTEHLRGA